MTLTHAERRPLATDGDLEEFFGSEASLPDRFPGAVESEFSQFRLRVVEEAIAAARPATYQRRAEDLEAARPRPGDFRGKATAEDLRERDQRLAEQAAACREHADVLRRYPTALGAYEAEIVRGLIGGEA